MDPVIPPAELATDSTPTPLHLSVTRTWGNHALPVKSPEWRALRADVLERDNRTCASCAYPSPHPRGRGLKIDHRDGNASNNHPANLRIHCPPCEAIRHCRFAGIERWLILAKSDIDQAEIVRRTRKLFEGSGSIPNVLEVDACAVRVKIGTVNLANKLMKVDREDLSEEDKGLRGFFTQDAKDLFAVTMDIEPTQPALPNALDPQAPETLETERYPPWITFSPEKHSTLQNFFIRWPPSTTSKSKVAWISIRNPRLPDANDHGSADEHGINQAWETTCAGRQPTTADLDELAQQFNELTGKWMIFAPPGQINALWSRIGTATHAGTLGISAKVSPENDSGSHVICIHTQDYTDEIDVDRVRGGLRRLGVKWRIGYKPDIYTHCRVYMGNTWGIAPTRYHT